MVPAKAPELSLVYADEGNAVVLFRNVLVQLRRGPLVVAMFERINMRVRALQRAHPAGIGLIVVLDPGAPVADAGMRAHQMAMLREMTGRGRVCTAIALLGTGVANEVRGAAITATRTMANVSDQRTVHSVPEAARWLAQAMDAPAQKEFAAELERAVELVRERYFAEPMLK